ncbi:ABC transporter substrate-binding protein [Paenibacillus mendelii]|uniref:ABC transporter substrate-binding protein n=1 Tax=Paenibacillus mendelii TaxID=206163 RepID=A0ABV6JK09_9BACL|nr:ABC transporter substrate-binding protein [Paenibacillus mendelii]MCQ6559177.1 ABC transporter substrate-binding protein [Paenibacillus mendelii]
MKKSVVGSMLVMVMLLGLVMGCSTNNNQPANDQPAAGASGGEGKTGKTKIQFWHSMGGNNGEYIDKMIKAYNESQDNVEVVGTFQGSYQETLTKLQQAVPANTAPDISMLERAFVPLLAEAEVLADFYPLLESTGMSEEDFLPGLLENVKFNGQLNALPFNRSTPLLHINKTLLDEKNLKVPATWDELEAVANALVVKENGEFKRYGYSMPYASWYPIAMIQQLKGAFFHAEGTGMGFDEEGVQTFEFLKKMQSTGALYYPPAQDSGNIVNSMFASGQIGMMMESTGVIGRHAGVVDFDYVTAYLPMKDQYSSPTGGANLVMFESSKNKEAAWDFMNWVFNDPKGGQQFILDSGYVPFTKKMAESAEMKAQWEKVPARKVAYEQLEHALDTNNDAAFAAVDQIFLKATEAIMYDNADIRSTLDSFKKEAEKLMQE